MASHRMPPTDLLDHLASADVDALRLILQHALQRLIEAEASAYIGAEPGEHSPTRTTYRHGHRARPPDTCLGRLDLAIPKVQTGSFLPSLLEPRRRIERALLAVIQEAYVHGVSTRKVDDVVAALGGGKAPLPFGLLMSKRARLLGSVLRARPLEEKIQVTRAFVRHVNPLLATRRRSADRRSCLRPWRRRFAPAVPTNTSHVCRARTHLQSVLAWWLHAAGLTDARA